MIKRPSFLTAVAHLFPSPRVEVPAHLPVASDAAAEYLAAATRDRDESTPAPASAPAR